MFSIPSTQRTRRAQPQVGQMVAMQLPSKGMNARDTFTVMGPDYAIALINVLVEPYGIKTREGYTEWAKNIPPGIGISPVWTVMSYYPPTVTPALASITSFFANNYTRMLVRPRAASTPPAGKLFASRGGLIYNVTAGGIGPWVAEVGVSGTSDFWTWVNFTNIAGTFLCITNDDGGYKIYNGATWAVPTLGIGAGQIANVDPALFAYVMEFKKRLWFVEKDSTRAWYLPVSQITGAATAFDFGEQFRKGGKLVALANFTVDGGEGIDDYLVGVSSQGNVVVYKGTDPSTAADFQLHGVWDVGPLPVGRRSVTNHGGDVQILSHFGVTPLSTLLATTQLGALEQRRLTYIIGPLIARLMHDYNTIPGWQVRLIPSEELMIIQVPPDSPEFGGAIFAMKITTGAWTLLTKLPYVSFVSIDSAVFCGTRDGRVVRAFDGPLDNVLIGATTGTPIQCQVTPAYQPLGSPGNQKVIKLLRPTFVTTMTPALSVNIMVDYGPPKSQVIPTLPILPTSLWSSALWDVALWSGLQEPIKEWIGCTGVGFVATAQLDYQTGGDTLLASIDYWCEQGGVM